MYKIFIKPFSANASYGHKGRVRYKMPDYKCFEKELLLSFPPINLTEPPPYKVYYEFAVSNKGFDGDNAIKPFQDVLAIHLKKKNIKFNDNQIYQWNVSKVIVPRGAEYIKFSIDELIKRQRGFY